MATSLISTSERAALNSVMDDIHETFAREITVYKEASKVVIITDPNFNPLYDTGEKTTSYVNTPVYKTFKVRIQYEDDIAKRYWSDAGMQSQIKLEAIVGTVRLKILSSDYDYIKDAKRFDVDGKRYVLNSSFRPHGLFDNKYYTIYLKPDS
jgi:hypothetical protein|tara:strand:+ start:2549 stop:3004 length:456 start_codon:yes stop_codon:yes gene_type:complete